MSYSVLVKVTSTNYNGQKFFMYKHGEQTLSTLNAKEAKQLAEILAGYLNVFSEIEIVPREDEEIKLLETFWGKDGRPLDFDFENVDDDCPEIIKKLEATFDSRISGIDRIETVRQTFED